MVNFVVQRSDRQREIFSGRLDLFEVRDAVDKGEDFDFIEKIMYILEPTAGKSEKKKL